MNAYALQHTLASVRNFMLRRRRRRCALAVRIARVLYEHSTAAAACLLRLEPALKVGQLR
jgi:hypothetical protein